MAEVLLLAGIGVLLVCLLLTLLAFFVFSGLFTKVEVGTGKPPVGEVTLAYKFGRGPYKDAGQICSTVSILDTKGKHRTINIYYDDPKTVPSHELRYAVGAILSEDGSEEDEEFKRKLLEEGFKMFKLPRVSFAVSTVFPYISSVSILVAIARVYPAMETYIKEHCLCAHPMLEIYDGDKIHFMAPLAKQNEFYVEEAEDKGINLDEDEEIDSEAASFEESMIESSVSRSETSGTTLMGDYSDSDTEDKDDGEKTRPSELLFVSGDQKETKKQENSELLDSGFSSEQVTSPDISPQKLENVPDKTGEISDGNESGSSFEEIQMDPEQQLPSEKEIK